MKGQFQHELDALADMQITVTVDEAIVVDAARKAFAEAFRQPEYRDRQGGAGYETLRGQVAEFVRTMDLREHIKGAARAALDNVVHEVIETELRAHLKAAAKAMRQEGTLFDMPNDAAHLPPASGGKVPPLVGEPK